MKSSLRSSFFGLMLILGLVAAPVVNAQEQTAPVQPPNSSPLSPAAAEILKLLQAGVKEDVLLGYIANSTNAFHLNADHLIQLQTNGVPSAVTTAMLQRDSALVQPAPVPASQPPTVTAGAVQPTAANIPTINEMEPAVTQFYQALLPYGNWMQLPNAGWVWQPYEATTNSAWRPYVDGGRWAWTDHGWYWASDYPWGWAPFHYGRWDHLEKLGWVWFPDTVWAPSWVSWRQSDDYVGWAPLPPNALADQRVINEPIVTNYDFGLQPQAYTFVNVQHVFVHNIRPVCLPYPRVREVFPHCRVVNHYGPGKYQRGVVNKGLPVERVAFATGRKLTPLPDYKREFHHGGHDRRHHAYAPAVPPVYSRTAPFPYHREEPQFRPPGGSALPAAPRLDGEGKVITPRNNDPGFLVTPSRPAITPMNPISPPMNPVVPPVQPQRREPTVNAFAPVGPVHPVAPPAREERPIRNWGGVQAAPKMAQAPVAPIHPPVVSHQSSAQRVPIISQAPAPQAPVVKETFAPKHAVWSTVAPQHGDGRKDGRSKK